MPTTPIQIRSYHPSDWPTLWPILQATISTGDTFAFAPESSADEIKQRWINTPQAVFVAHDESGNLLGSYYLKPNQPGLGSHVCNAGYVVSNAARGQGIATLMCEHSQREAKQLGYRAMQFNLVVSTNSGAVRLWQRQGFIIIGTLPGAFAHRQLGDVDAHVMFKRLAAG
ncbi:MAG TPA: GNAT family N-acetyltransferase [Burkholderiaceae bacterium]